MIDKLKWVLFLITHTEYWVLLSDYNHHLDKKIKELMVEHKFKYQDNHYARLGGLTLWISNHPYGSFTVSGMDGRPSRRTIYEAGEKFQRDKLDSLSRETL